MTGIGQAQPVDVAGCPGWLHMPPPGTARSRGVVLCGADGYEGLATHRGLWALGQGCAAAGLPTLRFDPPGCGDAPGEDLPDRMEAWRDSVLAAADWLRRHAGVAEVALCGLRLGALVAAQAAARRPGGFAALALLAPVASGRVHLRALALTAGAAAGRPLPDEAGWIEVGGERLHRDDLDRLGGWELSSAVADAAVARVLLMERRPPTVPSLPGVVTRVAFEDAAEFLTHAHLARLPLRAFAQVADWLRQDALPAASATAAGAAPVPVCAPLAEPRLALGDGTVERMLRFGPGGAMTGVLCTPAARRRVVALLLNTGANPRAGAGRLGVRIARRLARRGVASLRIDLPGLGDSDAVPGAADPAAPPDTFRAALAVDARAALDLLSEEIGTGAADGAARCLVVGICAGADTALRLALIDRRVGGLALFNLPAFDRTQGGAPALDGGPPPGEARWTRRPRMLLRRLRAEADHVLATQLCIESGLDRPSRWMRQLAVRGTRVLLAYAAGDRGLRELRAHFGRFGRRLAATPNVHRAVLEGGDHAFAGSAAQAEALRLIEDAALRLDRDATPAVQLAVQATQPAASFPAARLSAR